MAVYLRAGCSGPFQPTAHVLVRSYLHLMHSLSSERIQLLLRRCIELWRQNFAKSEQARARLASLGITDLALLDRLQCGFSNGKLPEILPPDDILKNDLIALGLLTPKGRERFPNALIFPCYEAAGQIANVLAWTPEGTIKTLEDLPLPPWNLTSAKSARSVFVTPSLLDSLALLAAGEPHAITIISGRTRFDPFPLKNWGVQKLVVVHGHTQDARSEIDAVRTVLGDYPHHVVTLAGVSGAGEMLVSRGAKILSESLVKAEHGIGTLHVPGMLPLPDGFTLVIGNRRYEVRGVQVTPSKMKAVVRLERGGKLHVDGVDLLQARARRQLVIDLVRLTEESSDTIEADIVKLMSACELRAAQPDINGAPVPSNTMPEADRREAEAFGKDPKLIETILEDFERYGLVGERANKLISYIAMTSRKMARPISVMTISSSGTGKSALQEVICALCPAEDSIKNSNLSPKALFHREKDSLRHKLYALEEVAGVGAAAYALRVLISSGELITEVATKDPTSGRLVSMRNHVKGPVSVSITTTSPNTDQETRSRFFVLSTDESTTQTDAIMELQRQQHTLTGLQLPEIREAICRRHHAFQRILQPLHVINPLVDRLSGLSNRLTARRDQPKLLYLVNAIAFLRQMQKPVKQYHKVNYIEVDEADLKIAATLVQDLFSPANTEISRPARELLVVLDVMRTAARKAGTCASNGEEFLFTRREVREFAKWERTRVHRYLRELVDLEFVTRDRSRRGSTERYALVWDGDLTFGHVERIMPFDESDGGTAPKTAA